MKLVTGIAVLLLAITVNALPSTEAPEVASADSLVAPGAVLFEPAVEAKATVDSLLQEGKDMGACATLASTTIKEVEDSVGAQQSILNALDNGDKCPLKGQAGVDAAKKALEDAKQDKADADKAYGAAKAAPVAFGPKAFNTMDQNSCSIFTNDPAYIAAVGAKDRAKKSAEQAAGAVKNAGDALDAAKEAQEKARKECYCTVRANYNKAWAAATENNEENTKAYTKGKHMQCVLDGKDADDCDVGDIPEVKAIDLADGVPAQECVVPTPNPTPVPTPVPTEAEVLTSGHCIQTSNANKWACISNMKTGGNRYTGSATMTEQTCTEKGQTFEYGKNDNHLLTIDIVKALYKKASGQTCNTHTGQSGGCGWGEIMQPHSGNTCNTPHDCNTGNWMKGDQYPTPAQTNTGGYANKWVISICGPPKNTETLTGCGKMHKAPANLQTKSGWTICYLKGSDPQSDRTAQCNTLVPHNGKFGCWHYHSSSWNPSNGGSSNPPTQACGENTQQSTRYSAWGGTSHYLVACIKN